METGKCIKTFVGHFSSIRFVENIFDDILISGDASGLIKIWKIETGECLRTIDAHTDTVETILLISNNIFATC